MKSKRIPSSVSLWLKGWAILAVVWLHFEAAFLPNSWWQDPNLSSLVLGLNQLGRFSVPLFIALSGYGLALRAQKKVETPIQFWKTRFRKLIPLYLFWSILILSLNDWVTLGKLELTGWVKPLWYGSADYHLYFVPMILGCYLLFPWLNRLSKNKLKLFWLLAFLGQIFFASWYYIDWPNAWLLKLMIYDQWAYRNLITWLGYFVFGIIMTRTKRHLSPKFWFSLTVVGFLFSWFESVWLYADLESTTASTLFTRIPVIIYAYSFIGLCLSQAKRIKNWFQQQKPTSNQLIQTLGRESYLIYLNHTLLITAGQFILQDNQYTIGLAYLCLTLAGLVVVRFSSWKSWFY